MEKKYEIYFEKYINDIISHYKLLNINEAEKLISKDKLLNFIKWSNGLYITEKDLESENIIKKLYEGLLNYSVAFESLKSYYDEYIYIDKYGIGSFCIEKDNIYIIDNLYNRKNQISISNFMGINYIILDKFSISQEQKFNDVLEFIHLQIKRGNLKVRVLDIYDRNKTKETDIFKIVEKYNTKEYTKENADNILTELKSMYLNAYNKDYFLEYFVEVNLFENNRSNTGLWGIK